MGILQLLGLPTLPTHGAQSDRGKSIGNDGRTGRLARAAEDWRQTHVQADERIATLKESVKSHYASSHPKLCLAIEKSMVKLDDILNKVDQRLADSLSAASNATNEAARNAELKNAKTVLAGYIAYVKSQPLIDHLDRNPLVKIELKRLLIGGLSNAAKDIR